MNRLSKLLIAALCCVSLVSFTSCLGSDDDDGIDYALYQTWLSYITGNYYGESESASYANKLYFYNSEKEEIANTSYNDSVADVVVRYFKGDSIVTVEGVPNSVLAKEITGNDELKAAIEGVTATQTLKAKFVFYNISSPYAYYSVHPYTVEYANLKYANGETHNVKLVFYSGTYGVFYYSSARSMNQFSLYMAAVYVDGNLVQTIYDGGSNTEKAKRACLTVFCTR